MGYGYDARFANSFIGYGDDARIVNRLRVSCFCLAVTVTETGFVTIAVTEFLHGLLYPNRYRNKAVKLDTNVKILNNIDI